MTALEEEVVDRLGIDQGEAELGRPGDLALAGDLPGLSAELALMESSGLDPIPVVRAVQRRLLALAGLRARLDGGQSHDLIMRSVYPKRDQPIVGQILRRWTPASLSEAFARVQKLERELLLQPVPGSAALGELLFQLARVARR
jgi:DNA polymerase-3 subunit delta